MKQTEERKQAILRKLREKNRVYVTDLSEQFGVSEVTIRKNLVDLEKRGELKRTYGGATLAENAAIEPVMSVLELTNIEAKRAIAARAFEMIEEGDAIALDASSTLRELARIIRRNPRSLTVITSSILLAHDLADCAHVDLIILGGHVRSSIGSVMGPMTMDMLKGIHVDKAFIGTNGIDLKFGFSTPNLFECELKRTMIECATQSFVLADKSKINRSSLGQICPISRVDYLITDEGFPEEMARAIEELGPQVLVAAPNGSAG